VVQAPRDRLARLGDGPVTARVDLAGLRPGRYNLRVRAEAPAGVRVVRIEPPAVDVRIR